LQSVDFLEDINAVLNQRFTVTSDECMDSSGKMFIHFIGRDLLFKPGYFEKVIRMILFYSEFPESIFINSSILFEFLHNQFKFSPTRGFHSTTINHSLAHPTIFKTIICFTQCINVEKHNFIELQEKIDIKLPNGERLGSGDQMSDLRSRS